MKTNNLRLMILASLLGLLLLAGCRAVTPPRSVLPQAATVTPATAALRNATYTGILPDQPITLTDGSATYEEEGAGAPFVQLVDQLIATGDLDGDGVEDAAGLLVDYTTGSADFVYLAALLSTQPGPMDAIQIGDRTPVKALAIVDGQVIVDYVGPGPGDAACCPAWNMRGVYGVEDGKLVERSNEDLGAVTLADLNGTAWRLVDLGAEQPSLLPDTEISLRFDDGQLSGSAGCNDYTGAASAPEELPQSFAAGPLAVTAMRCDEPIADQETTYLDLLGKTVAWRYAFGQLALTYKLEGDVFGELLYAPLAADGGTMQLDPACATSASAEADAAAAADVAAVEAMVAGIVTNP